MLILLSLIQRYRILQQHVHASRVQLRIRKKIEKQLALSLYGKEKGSFSTLPVCTYEDIAPYIERMLAGEPNVLVPTRVSQFAKSSGTTNDKSKYLPTPSWFLQNNHYRAGKDMLALYIASSKNTRFIFGKTLGITGSLAPSPGASDIFCGDVSALLIKELPWWAAQRRALDLSIALLPSWEEKAAYITEHAGMHDIRAIAGTPTWVSILFEHIIKKNNVTTIESVWPKLQVFFHGAVAFTPYKPLFEKLSKKLQYFEVYNASEGYFAVQQGLEYPGELLLLINHDIFYEFIPLSEFGTPSYKILQLHEVSLDEQYVLIISTTSGLYRYVVGDTIRFTHLSPYRIVITGRTKHFINAFGEELVVENANTAILRACEATHAAVAHYTAGPIYMDGAHAGAHQWYIEYATSPSDQALFNQVLDTTLRELNSDYDAKRTGDVIMKAPYITIVPQGTFYRFMEQRGKVGGQHKVPPLSNTREYLDMIETMLR